jgi:hypothetical protein
VFFRQLEALVVTLHSDDTQPFYSSSGRMYELGHRLVSFIIGLPNVDRFPKFWVAQGAPTGVASTKATLLDFRSRLLLELQIFGYVITLQVVRYMSIYP